NAHSSSIYGYTAHYAPLEQIRRAGTDQRSDLYSLGATMCTLLTGKVPPDALSRIAEKEDGNPDPLRAASEFNPKVPLALSAVINRAMALNRSHRHATAVDLRKELAQIATTESSQPISQPQVTHDETPPRSPMPLPGSTVKSADSAPPQISSDQQMSTVRVPSESTAERKSSGPTATSFAEVVGRKRPQRKPFIWIAAGAAVLLLGIGLVSWILWPRGGGQQQSNATQGSNGTTNSSLSDMNRPTAPMGMVY